MSAWDWDSPSKRKPTTEKKKSPAKKPKKSPAKKPNRAKPRKIPVLVELETVPDTPRKKPLLTRLVEERAELAEKDAFSAASETGAEPLSPEEVEIMEEATGEASPSRNVMEELVQLDVDASRGENIKFFLNPEEAIDLVSDLPGFMIGPTERMFALARAIKTSPDGSVFLHNVLVSYLRLNVSRDRKSRTEYAEIQRAERNRMLRGFLQEDNTGGGGMQP